MNAKLLFVGEAPGQKEDQKGIPFIGPAGLVFQKAIAHLGLEEQVIVTNAVKCRPPGNRKPTAQEVTTCGVHLKAQLDILRPVLVVGLGATAYEALTGNTTPISAAFNKIYKYTLSDGTMIPMVFMYHPAFLLHKKTAGVDVSKEYWEQYRKVYSLYASLSSHVNLQDRRQTTTHCCA